MNLGVAYYPERCSEQQQRIDYQKMKDAGIGTIRIAEFAWSKMEPKNGEFQWKWLDRSLEIAEEYGLKVILCTPTACPPIWLTEEYPDVLPVNEKGQRMVFGKRQHRCYQSEAYLKYSERIVTEMAKRYGKNKNVVAWQIDNELGGERQRCYCDNCKSAFQKQLAKKYDSIEELNKRWGAAFWAAEYQNFDQINVPLEIDGQLMIKHHPSLELEFWRFSSNNIVEFCRMQERSIRKYSDAIVTTNTDSFTWGDCVDVYELFKTLDEVGFDLYSSDNCEISFYADMMRSIKGNGNFWMLEYGVFSNKILEELKLLADRGCEFFSFFTMNPFPWGQEQGYGAMLTMTGKPSGIYKLLKESYEKDNCIWEETSVPTTDVGIFYDFDSSWTFSIATWKVNKERWIYAKYMLEKVYRSLYESERIVDFISEAKNIWKYRTIVIPRCVIYKQDLENELIEFVKAGGKLIVTEDLFIKNMDNVYLTELPNCYKDFFGDTDGLFLPETDIFNKKTILEKQYGKGCIYTIKEDADLEVWKNVVEHL